MTFEDAILTQPQWVQLWLNWLMIGGIFLPLALVIWKSTRWLGLGFFIATAAGGFAIFQLYEYQGYTRLLGLPHLIIWIPGAYLLWRKQQQDIPQIPRYIIWVVLATVLVSLAFDITDVARYILGERGSMIPPQA